MWRRGEADENTKNRVGEFIISEENIAAETKAGCDQVPLYLKFSPDLNAIEGWWRKLKLYLEQQEPIERESRDQFLKRLRRAVDAIMANISAPMRERACSRMS